MSAPEIRIVRSRRAKRSPRAAYIPANYQSDANSYEHSRSAPVMAALLITSALWLAGGVAVYAAMVSEWIPRYLPLRQGVNSIQLSASIAAKPRDEPLVSVQVVSAARLPVRPKESLAAGKIVLQSLPRSPLGLKNPMGIEASQRHDHAAVAVAAPTQLRREVTQQPPLEVKVRPSPRRQKSPPQAAISKQAAAPSKRSRGVRSRSPQLVHNPQPDFPPQLLAAEVEGRVIVLASVRGDGKVGRVALHRSSGYQAFDQAALKAVTRWRFNVDPKVDPDSTMDVRVPLSFRIQR